MIRTALALVVMSGCALGIQGPPKNYVPSEPLRCDAGKGGVVADGLLSATLGVTGLAAIGDDAGLGGALLALGGLAALSAARGNTAANRCAEALERRDAYLARHRSAPAAGEGPDLDLPRPRARRPRVTVPDDEPASAPASATPAPPAPAATAPPPSRSATTDDPWADFWEIAP